VAVLDRGNTVGIRTVKLGEQIGTMWAVAEGLKAGERVVAEGVQKVRPGVQVSPKPFVEGN
jgi:membrane fusion protein (multidrug efflux system)